MPEFNSLKPQEIDKSEIDTILKKESNSELGLNLEFKKNLNQEQ